MVEYKVNSEVMGKATQCVANWIEESIMWEEQI
jgi:hypothetical protein